jgi:hypothetical protein
MRAVGSQSADAPAPQGFSTLAHAAGKSRSDASAISRTPTDPGAAPTGARCTWLTTASTWSTLSNSTPTSAHLGRTDPGDRGRGPRRSRHDRGRRRRPLRGQRWRAGPRRVLGGVPTVPARGAPCCMFTGPNLDRLYVTTVTESRMRGKRRAGPAGGVGTVNLIQGIAAIGNANFFAHNTHYVFANLNVGLDRADPWLVSVPGGLWRVRQEPVLTLNGCGRARRELHRAAADDAGVSALVADHLLDGHPRDVRVDRVRQADLGGLIEQGSCVSGSMRGAMFFGSRKRRRSAGGVSHPSDPAPSQTAERELVLLRAWRSAAQKATRAWNEWLAADGRERPVLYRCYVSRLAEEEQAAAELERTASLEDSRSSLRPPGGGRAPREPRAELRSRL